MKAFRTLRRLMCVAAVAVGVMAAPQVHAATTGLLILEGSDAQTFHSLNPYSFNFLTGMATFSTAPTLPIAYTNANPIGAPIVGKVSLGSLSSATPSLPTLVTMLASYSGIYLGSPSGCCSQTPLNAADAAILAGFLAAGRSVAIENYQGGAQFDAIVGTTGGAGAFIPGGGCFDGNIVAPGGAALFGTPVGSAIPSIGCFGHQSYDKTFFDSLGLTTYIATNPLFPSSNVVISNGGGGLIAAIPEPASMLLLGAGLAGLGAIRRRRA